MNIAAAEPLWSELQLSWLQAMGHVVYLERSLEPEPPAAEAPAQPTAAPAVEEKAAHSAPRRAAPVMAAAEPAPAAAVRNSALRRTRVGLPDRLQIALLRACAANPADAQTQQLMASWPLDELRANPAAKRALWPQLRALRRKGNA